MCATYFPHTRAGDPVVVHGRRGCGLTQGVRRYLDRADIPYHYVDLDLNPLDETRLAWITGGRVHSPVVSVGGEVLVQPTTSELELTLTTRGLPIGVTTQHQRART
ncbi:glutaredoxin [Kribbella flavida DSM 17836]|uniref:Glutaredoxin n=1 Tax=Kribbella flavida (strain DSM 17836 / JCM 10339 / NBRC 14399) TaxID=479435 RepID=D2PR87_KRIFD|nr:glutaredoxin domain-containing protein [Kribbella flavida]ADB33035.1 glutaredoxin [Kribbella flavida DSM 17836]